MNNEIKVVIAGEGGQGVQTVAEAVAITAKALGKKVSYIPSFGVEQRGTPSVAYLIISDKEILYPKFDVADILFIKRKRAISKVIDMANINTEVIFDCSTMEKKDFGERKLNLFASPATKYAAEKFSLKAYNILVYGVIVHKLNFDRKIAWQSIYNILESKIKDKETKELYHQAFEFGYELILEQGTFSEAEYMSHEDKKVYKNQTKLGEIDRSRCKGCMICVLKCPVKALKPGSDIGFFGNICPELDINKCIACGNCRRFCPDGAIAVNKLK